MNNVIKTQKHVHAQYEKKWQIVKRMADKLKESEENTYIKIKQIAENLRAMAQRNGWFIVTATQKELEKDHNVLVEELERMEGKRNINQFQ